MRKKILAVLLVLALFLQVPAMYLSQAMADTGSTAVGFPFFTNITLVDQDTGQTLGGDDVGGVSKDAYVAVYYDFSIPDGAIVHEGDTYSFILPDEIALSSAIAHLALNDANGNTVAYVDVTPGGNGLITFTSYAATHQGVSGEFMIGARFAEENIANTEIVKIPFVSGEATTYVDVYFDQPAATNNKTGSYNASTGVITWTLTLNSNDTTIKNGVFTDDIVPGHPASGPDKSQTYVDGSFKVTAEDGSTVFDGSQPAGSQGVGTFTYVSSESTSKTGTIQYAFAEPFEDTVTVTFQTVLADPSPYFGGTVTNAASFAHNDLTQSMSGSVNVPVPNYVVKSGSYNATTKQLDWNVTVNPDALSLHGVKVTDVIPQGLVLDAASVRLDGVVSSSFTLVDNTFIFDVGFIEESHVLTFSTNLPADYWQKNHSEGEYYNTAKMTATDNSYLQSGATSSAGGIGPSNSVITKSSLGYDFNTHRITWQVVVNGSGNTLPDALLTDTLEKGQKYLPDTFQITASAPVNVLTGAQSFSVGNPEADPAVTDTLMRYRFGAISSSYTITYQTELTDSSVWAGNASATYHNAVVLEPGGGIASSSSQAQQPVAPNVIAKSGIYDYATHEITWTIVANQSRIPLTITMVEDTLEGNGLDDFDFESDSITVDGVAIAASESNPPGIGSFHYDSVSKKLTVNLGDLDDQDLSKRTKTVTFKMKLNKTGEDYDAYFSGNGDKTITNSATLKSNENMTTTTQGSAVIHNTLVGKTGYYTPGKAYIDWAVQVNQNGVALNEAELTDTLAKGLQLDTSSIKLYQQTLNADGSLTPAPVYDSVTQSLSVTGTPITLTKENVSFDASTGVFRFTMPTAMDQSKPYLLTFRTNVEATYHRGTTFSNSISLASTSYQQGGTSGSQQVSFSTSGGSAWGSTGDVVVTKKDSATGGSLAGAEFGLYDGFDNLIRISNPTDSDGQTIFDHLPYNTTLSVKELTPPSDYELANGTVIFQLRKSDGAVVLFDEQGNEVQTVSNLAFTDVRKIGTISFTKYGDGGSFLAGAVFTLCDANGTPIPGFSSQTSDDSGNVTFADVPYGTYLIKETSAPLGYLPLSIAVELHDSNKAIKSDGEANTLDLGDQQDQPCGSLTLTKYGAEYDGGTSSIMQGATFRLLDGDNAVVGGTRTTNASGQIVFSDLPVGMYTLQEIAASTTDYQIISDYHFAISSERSPAERQLTYSATDIKKSGSVVLTKVDGLSALPGATFTLYDATGTDIIQNESGAITATSDDEGIVRLDDVPYGEYILKETSAPTNYQTVNPIMVSLHAATLDLGSVSDARLLGKVRFVKTDGFSTVPGAQFTLSGNGITPQVVTSDSQGVVEFANIPYFDTPYTISETLIPASYYRAVADFQVTLNEETVGEGAVLQLPPVVDVPFGSITVTKTGEDGATVLAGATFDVLDLSGDVIQTQTTDGAGVAFFDDLALNPIGETFYTLRETIAPTNYTLAEDVVVTLSNTESARDAVIEVSDALKRGVITLTKVDQAGNVLQGATFTLYDAETLKSVERDGELVTALSGEDGTAVFDQVPYGTYVIRETASPSDYIMSDASVDIDLVDANRSIAAGVLAYAVPITNTIKTADIKLTKTDANGAALAGAVFTLYDANATNKIKIEGKDVVATSDANGLVYLQDIPYGDYTLIETNPPSGYAATDPISISLHDSNVRLSDGVLDLGSAKDNLLPVVKSVKTSDGMPVELLTLGGMLLLVSLLVMIGVVRRARKRIC